MRGPPGLRGRRVHRSAGEPRRPGCPAGRLLRSGRPGVRRQGGDRLRHGAAAGPSGAARRARRSHVALHPRRRAPAAAGALGASRAGGGGGVHRVDGQRQAAPLAAARRAPAQGGPRGPADDVILTHPDKQLFPEDGITKAELAAYYEAIAPVLLPHIAGRPITMERYPAGIGQKGFWQKSVTRGVPDWLERVEVPKKNGTVQHAVVRDARALLWLANQNSITLHVWPSR